MNKYSGFMNTIYRVDGMHCEHCVAHVREEVGNIPGVSDTKLALADGLLTVMSDAPIEFEAIAAAVAEAGDYTVVEA